MIKVFDNVLNDSYAALLEHDCQRVISYNYYHKTVVNFNYNDPNIYDTGQFSTMILSNDQGEMPQGWYMNRLYPLVTILEDNVLGCKIKELQRVKYNLISNNPGSPEFHYNTPHPDSFEPGFISMVYYCNDSDGDTFLFNEFYDHECEMVIPPLSISERVSPKRNRLVMFESNRYHASSYPRTSDYRSVINFIVKV